MQEVNVVRIVRRRGIIIRNIWVLLLLLLILTSSISHEVEAIESSADMMSQISVEGFTAINDLVAKLVWGNVTQTKEIKHGDDHVEFIISASNIRSNISISFQPDGFFIELIPTAMGYAPRKLSIGSNIKVNQALKIMIRETLTIINLTTFITPPKNINTVMVNGHDVPFITSSTSNTTAVTLPSSIIVDFQAPVNITIKGYDFIANITAIKGLEESVIYIKSIVVGNVSNVSVRIRSAKVLALQKVEIPLEFLNVTNVLQDYGVMKVVVSRENNRTTTLLATNATTTLLTKHQQEQPMLIIMRYKWIILMSALAMLSIAIASEKRSLAVIALFLFIAYFALIWLGEA